MNIKKFVAGITTLALMGTTMALGSVFTASADTSSNVIGTAYLSFANGVAEQWSAGELGDSVDITGNGDYTLSVDLDENQGSESILLLLISTDINIYAEDADGNKLYDDMKFTINSISVDGKEIEYTGPSNGAVATENDGISYRYNILNTWGNSVKDIDGNVVNTSNVTVEFSVSGLDVDNPEVTTVTDLVPGDSNNNTTTSKVASKVDYSLYNDVINKAGATVSSNNYDDIHDNLGYYLFDINGDGVKELIVADSFESELNTENNTNYIWGYYDIYTIKDNKLVEIKQNIVEDNYKFLQIAQDSYLSLTVSDGKLAYVILDPDDNSKMYVAFVITGYTEQEDGSLSLTGDAETGDIKDFPELKLYDYTDKTALNELTGSKNSNSTDTKTTTSTKKTDSPATGDTGLGAVAVAFGVAGLSAFAFRKKD